MKTDNMICYHVLHYYSLECNRELSTSSFYAGKCDS